MVPGKEPEHRNGQCSGIECRVVVRLHKRLALLAPAALHDLCVERVARNAPGRGIGLEIQLLGHPHSAIERNPAHDLTEDIVTNLAADLPDTRIWEVPVLTDPIHQATEHSPGSFGHLMVSPPDVGSLHDFTIDVELQLAHRPVPDPHRSRVLIPAQMIELAFYQVAAAIDAVHDLKVAATFVPADLLEKTHELIRLTVVPHRIQRCQSK